METNTLNSIELDIAKEIVNIALAKAADSFSFFTREKVLIKGIDVSLKEISSQHPFSGKPGNNLVILKTFIKGELEGNCYLVFSKEEVNALFQVALPDDIRNDPAKLLQMGNAILLEADNIITASVVTQFSNLLKFKMYGYVPELIVANENNQVNQLILAENKSYQSVLNFNAHFITNEKSFEPEFIWVLNSNKFIEGIKRFAESSESQKIKEKLGLL